MSDETIQYITTDYLIEVDGGDPTPAPIEYIVELGQVGVQGIPGEKGEPGFSPTVGYILNDNTFKINITNQDGVTQTPNLYDYFPNKNEYLKADGSNADNLITINGIKIEHMTLTSINSSLYLQAGNGPIVLTPSMGQKVYYTPYNTSVSNKYELATIGDIPTVGNGTITITQGGVTKGTFTTNQSGDATIDLDAGGGSIANPLVINSDNGLKNLSIGYNSDNELSILSTWLYNGTVPIPMPAYLIGGTNNPISLSNTSTNHGLKTINLNYNTDTLELDADNYLNVKDVFLSKDGSNATNNFKIHNTELTQYSVDISNVRNGGFSVAHATNNKIYGRLTINNSKGSLQLPSISIASYPYTGTLHSNRNEISAYGDIIITNGASYKLYYGTKNANNEVAKVGDIPTTMTGADGTNAGTAGLVPAPTATDNTKFLRGDGTWQTVGGGGSSYTAGTGIDITNDIISIDTSVVAQLSDIPDVSNFVTNSSLATTLASYVQSSSLATVATTGNYTDLNGRPNLNAYVTLDTTQTISGTKTFNNNIKLNGAKYLQYTNGNQTVNLIGTNSSTVGSDYIWVGNGFDYLMLHGKGTRPQYISGAGTAKDIALYSDIPTVPTNISSFINDSGYITNSALSGYATQTWVGQQGYITGITSSDVTTALGYTPYSSSNPDGYTSNVGTVTSVNNVQPDSSGNVSITPTITVIDGGNA